MSAKYAFPGSLRPPKKRYRQWSHFITAGFSRFDLVHPILRFSLPHPFAPLGLDTPLSPPSTIGVHEGLCSFFFFFSSQNLDLGKAAVRGSGLVEECDLGEEFVMEDVVNLDITLLVVLVNSWTEVR